VRDKSAALAFISTSAVMLARVWIGSGRPLLNGQASGAVVAACDHESAFGESVACSVGYGFAGQLDRFD
jgi:hypothetical protein